MATQIQNWKLAACCLCVYLTQSAFAFSLLGPFAPWMTPDVGFIHDEAYDVGGPRNLGDEFRWNVPVLTYGFDDDFKNFFGQPGIDAVEKAVAILNALPPASQIDLVQARAAQRRTHATAEATALFDLKTVALTYLLEELGLANPIRFTWIVTTPTADLNASESTGPYEYVIQRNFDPFVPAISSAVNGIRWSYAVDEVGSGFWILPQPNREAFVYGFDPAGGNGGFQAPLAAMTMDTFSGGLRQGEYYGALTRDDFGGIQYLLSSTNINVEPCLPTVSASDGSSGFVNIAPRPGVEKISFLRYDPGQSPVTNYFTDTYLIDSELHTQALRRIIQAPDILFTAANHPRQLDTPALVRRTGPNFSHQNETGSGILQPEVVISFQKLGDIYREPLWSDGVESIDYRWSVFDSKTLTPSPIFPVGPAYQGGRTLSVRKIEAENGGSAVEWKLRLIAGVQYSIESSPDLVKWTAVTNVTALPIQTLTNSAASDSVAVFWRARRISQ